MPQLTWKYFHNTLSSHDFIDVTLVAEDNYQVHVSKMMLCSASLFFRKILMQNNDSHPMIYLDGVSKIDLQNIVDFVYKGEITVGHNYLANLISVSEDLQITGILEAFVTEQDKSSRKSDSDTVLKNDESIFTSPDINRSEEMTIEHESLKIQDAGNSLLDSMKVEDFDEHSNENIIQSNPLLPKQIHHITRNNSKNKNNIFTKRPKPLNEIITKEIPVDLKENVDRLDADTDMTDIPEYWKYVGKCSFTYRVMFGTETYNKCLICSKKVGNDKKNLARHWRKYHLENQVKESVTDYTHSVESNDCDDKSQNIQKVSIDIFGNENGNPSKKTLYQKTIHSNETDHIPKYWDEYNGKSQKDGYRFKCNICGILIKSESKMLEKHWRKYHSEAPEDQVIIVKEGENSDDVIATLMDIKFVGGFKGIRATCKICGLSRRKSDLVRHIDSNHLSGAKYKCGDCSKVFKGKRAHETHSKNCSEKIAINVPERVMVQMSNFDLKLKIKSMIGRNESEYICKECGVSKASYSRIQHHVELSHMKVDHPCKLCENRVWFKTSQNLNGHIKNQHK